MPPTKPTFNPFPIGEFFLQFLWEEGERPNRLPPLLSQEKLHDSFQKLSQKCKPAFAQLTTEYSHLGMGIDFETFDFQGLKDGRR